MFADRIFLYSQGSFRIQGNDTPLEIYHPDAVGTFPLVFVLHGSTGALTLKAAEEPAGDNLGEKMLARNCFVVVLPHYLEAIGRKSLISQDEIATRFSVLVAVAGMLLDRAEALPWVKDQPVYIFGQSLGGYLGIALGFRRNEIAAISEVSGGLPEGYGLERVSKPRVLISHGSADTVVPASDAGVLAHYCSEHGISFNENIYTGESHYLSERARALVEARTLELFLQTN